ncbi:MAG: Bro-N domain-containing protein [Oscillospiraceae bacterium]|nr:Bro-N domain-containing protein [Oscillospiraceae bacterium]
MNDLKIWNYEDTTIRTLEIDGEMWFVGKDVTSILGYANASKALADHVDDDDKLNNETLSSLGQRGGWLINESGVYALIFGSKLPTAKKFKRWVTSEVLPSIRKNGSYGIDTALTPELQVLIRHERMMQEQKKQLDAVQNKVEAIQEIFTMTPENWKKDVRVTVGKLSVKIAGDYSMMQELY